MIRYSLPYNNLLCTMLLVFTVPTVALPTHAQTSPSMTTVQVPLTDAQAKIMQERSKTLIDFLSRGEYGQARALLAPTLADQLTTEQIQEIWENLMNKIGKIKQQTKSRVIDTVNSDLVVIDTVFEKGQGEIIVTFNDEQQIVGVDFPKLESITEISDLVVQSLAERNFPRARGYLHPLLKTEIFPQQIQQRWDSLQQANGQFKRVVDTEVRAGSSVDESDVVILTLEFAKATKEMLVIFDDQRRIVGINLVE
ncbi:DUF3887 domain-containing protein [Aphanothece hegewaldii CCALA 016]|uniref:DUF3887 domain-containing protein n=1 Tax=Aphanothece hegewaldii CCALA 016 TaxID=2107694 RepID=A0A2T1LUT3_9CHRO|nr:DUF3887 domain-containing protein [Aphanothece hegewaldii]PSF35383.1 DUF3887 domain-containing protein [Aphanothece hegewaldii CCALA 016]